MGYPRVNSFFGCMGLETGAKIIGWLHLIFAVGLVCYTSILAADIKGKIGTVEDFDGFFVNMYKVMCAVAVTGNVHIILSSVLLFGISKRNTSMIRAWIMLMSLLYVIAIVFVIGITIVYGPNDSGINVFIAFLEGTAFFFVIGYCITCVHSLYEMLKSDESMCAPQ